MIAGNGTPEKNPADVVSIGGNSSASGSPNDKGVHANLEKMRQEMEDMKLVMEQQLRTMQELRASKTVPQLRQVVFVLEAGHEMEANEAKPAWARAMAGAMAGWAAENLQSMLESEYEAAMKALSEVWSHLLFEVEKEEVKAQLEARTADGANGARGSEKANVKGEGAKTRPQTGKLATEVRLVDACIPATIWRSVKAAKKTRNAAKERIWGSPIMLLHMAARASSLEDWAVVGLAIVSFQLFLRVGEAITLQPWAVVDDGTVLLLQDEAGLATKVTHAAYKGVAAVAPAPLPRAGSGRKAAVDDPVAGEGHATPPRRVPI